MSILSIRSGSIQPITEAKTSIGSDKSHTIVSVSQKLDEIDGVSKCRIQRIFMLYNHVLLQLNTKSDYKTIKILFWLYHLTYYVWKQVKIKKSEYNIFQCNFGQH